MHAISALKVDLPIPGRPYAYVAAQNDQKYFPEAIGFGQLFL